MSDTTAFPAPQPPSYGPPPTAPESVGMSAAGAVPPARQKTRLVDVVFGWRAALAVLVAGLLIGGVVGAGITVLVDHHGGSSTRPTQNFPGFQGFGGFGGGSGSSGSSGGSGTGGSLS